MSVIALQGIRGGVGSTSVSVGLAWALQTLGESVLVIDFSPDNLLRLHFNTPFNQTRGWARAYVDGLAWQDGAMRFTPGLDFLPFGTLSQTEYSKLDSLFRDSPDVLQQLVTQMAQLADYQWILVDLPHGYSPLANSWEQVASLLLLLLSPDPNSYIRLHQQSFSTNCHYLINNFTSNYPLQWDLHCLLQQTLSQLVPVVIHRDEAVPEALANKQPLGEYAPQSLASKDFITLANWCLIHQAKKIKKITA